MENKIVNPAIERSVLSILIQYPESIMDIQTDLKLKDNNFLIKSNKYIYNSILYLHNKESNPTPQAIYQAITNKKAREEIEAMGGWEYVQEISEMDVELSNMEFFINKLKQTYTRNQIYNKAHQMANQMVRDEMETLNPNELVAIMEEQTGELASEIAEEEEVKKVGENLWERLKERAENPSEIAGLTTGYNTLDKQMNGLRGGDLAVITARPKVGKSTLLMNIMANMTIKGGLPSIYIDSEMSTEEQEDRLVALLSGVDFTEVTNGKFAQDTDAGKAEDKMRRVFKATQMIKEANYQHYYMPEFDIGKVVALIKKHKYRDNIGIVFFDYIKMPSASGMSNMKEYQALGFLTAKLKDIAGKLSIPIVTAAQENREGNNQTTKDGTTVGGSDRILQLASKVMFLYKKSEEQMNEQGIDKGNRQIKITDQRNGSSDCEPINIAFDYERMKMLEV